MNVTSAELIGERLALVLMRVGQAGEDDWAVLAGRVSERDGTLFFDHERGSLELVPEWVSRIRVADPSIRSILLGAPYMLSLKVGNVSDEEAAALRKTGLRWPGT